MVVEHPAAADGRIAGEGDVPQRGAAMVSVHPATLIIAPSSVGLPGGDGEAIQDSTAVRPTASDHMVSVVPLDVVGVRDHAVGVSDVGVGFVVNVPAEDGDVVCRGALVAVGLRAREAAVNGHAASELKGAVAVIVRLPGALVWVVHTSSHPNFGAAVVSQRVLQGGVSVGPTGAVVGAGGVGLHITNRPGRAHRGRGKQG